ncbi:hypothetical protein [Rickettsiales endosymbiont of Stachyamoeba lipophora]|uniref:hypothetical protein n=1 Tax=Rickettsiales endosymbiont of Stachyamoeba lipophora TaxID=2486578 RepID=UPI000F655557|nr:hypothetical protein [Rickettsiales endosymbiont of Stachyamoeba lipophora]AZL15575.1 hypothetical protein EF513_03285 [Rickettsiales endosymbiont of Stachyamoeba lipophora]
MSNFKERVGGKVKSALKPMECSQAFANLVAGLAYDDKTKFKKHGTNQLLPLSELKGMVGDLSEGLSNFTTAVTGMYRCGLVSRGGQHSKKEVKGTDVGLYGVAANLQEATVKAWRGVVEVAGLLETAGLIQARGPIESKEIGARLQDITDNLLDVAKALTVDNIKVIISSASFAAKSVTNVGEAALKFVVMLGCALGCVASYAAERGIKVAGAVWSGIKKVCGKAEDITQQADLTSSSIVSGAAADANTLVGQVEAGTEAWQQRA